MDGLHHRAMRCIPARPEFTLLGLGMGVVSPVERGMDSVRPDDARKWFSSHAARIYRHEPDGHLEVVDRPTRSAQKEG